MHYCPECGGECYCDGEELWIHRNATHCTHWVRCSYTGPYSENPEEDTGETQERRAPKQKRRPFLTYERKRK